MELKDMIARRKSVRKYTSQPVDGKTLEAIAQFAAGMKPLYPHIRVAHKLVTKEQVRFYLPWKTPQLLAIYSETKEGYLENVGFLYQQMDLYLQSLGLGSCWMGLGKVRGDEGLDGMDFVILLAFGHTQDTFRDGAADFKREPLAKIADREDPALEPARLAPSSVNSQPWFFTHEGGAIHAFCSKRGVLRNPTLGAMNRIDMGIALAHLYVCNRDRFRFFRQEAVACPEGYGYIGSFHL